MSATRALLAATALIVTGCSDQHEEVGGLPLNACGGTSVLAAAPDDPCEMAGFEAEHRAAWTCVSGALECRLRELPGLCEDWVAPTTAEDEAETAALCDRCDAEMSCLDGEAVCGLPAEYGQLCDECRCGIVDCVDGGLECDLSACDSCQGIEDLCDPWGVPNVLIRCQPVDACGGMSDLTAAVCDAGQTCHGGVCTAIEVQGPVGEACQSNLECAEGLFCNLDYGVCTKHCGAEVDDYGSIYGPLGYYLDQVDPTFLTCSAGALCVDAGNSLFNQLICLVTCDSDADCSDPVGMRCLQAAMEDHAYCMRTGGLALGEPCIHSYDCQSGYCGGWQCSSRAGEPMACSTVCLDLLITQAHSEP